MGSWVLLHGQVVGLDMMQVKDLTCRCHRWCWGRAPSYCLHCCPVLWGLEAMSLKQKIRKASFILSFNWACGPGLCPALGPLAVSRRCGDTAWGLIHPFWKNASSGKVLVTPKSQCLHISADRGTILPFAHWSSQKTGALWPLCHMTICGNFFPSRKQNT